jgi:predicted DNA-binding WGR domain protein
MSPTNCDFVLPSYKWIHPTKKRYYLLILLCDLLGDWVVTKSWGSIHNSGGRTMHIAYRSFAEANTLVDKIIQARYQRGYILVNE